jgi:hypothetical protein
LILHGAEVLEKDADGLPVATRHRYGKGTAIFFGTALTWGYHKHPDPQAGEWIAAPALPQARQMAVSASTKAPRVFFRGLKCPDGLAAILTNPGPQCRVRVTFRGHFAEVADVLASRRIKPVFRHDACETEVELPAGGVCILRTHGKETRSHQQSPAVAIKNRNCSRAKTLENKAVLGISPPIFIKFDRPTTQNMLKKRGFAP